MSTVAERERARERAADAYATKEECCCKNDDWPSSGQFTVDGYTGARHGTRYRFDKGCRCDECTTAQDAYRARHNAARRMRERAKRNGLA